MSQVIAQFIVQFQEVMRHLTWLEVVDVAVIAVVLSNDVAALDGATAIYTDVWASMGQEDQRAIRREIFAPYQVNRALMDAAKGAVFLHCLPAHRGEEVTDEVLDGPRSIVFDQAGNRLYAQMALMAEIIGAERG